MSLQPLSTGNKIAIVVICFICAVIGFLIKIPVPLRGHDKLLHSAFYFMAAAFLHVLFRKGFFAIVIVLALFGVLIEYLQQLSNQVTHSHIHGRFDKEDIYANLKGLLLYSAVALIFFVCRKIFSNSRSQRTT
jgi:hypothetical protein